MGRRIALVVLAVLLIAGIVFAVFSFRNKVKLKQQENDSVVMSEKSNQDKYVPNKNFETQTFVCYKIMKNSDNTEADRKEVLGDDFTSSYVSINNQKDFKALVGYYSFLGKYEIQNDAISVVNQDGEKNLYKAKFDEDGNVVYLIIPIDGYKVYFG